MIHDLCGTCYMVSFSEDGKVLEFAWRDRTVVQSLIACALTCASACED